MQSRPTGSLNRHCQRVMVDADEAAQVGPDLAGGFEACGFGCRVLLLRGEIGALRVVLDIAKDPDGEQVPTSPRVSDKDEVLWLLHPSCVVVFHLALAIKIVKVPGQSNKHFDMEETRALERGKQFWQPRSEAIEIFLPGDVVSDLGCKRLLGVGSLGKTIRREK